MLRSHATRKAVAIGAAFCLLVALSASLIPAVLSVAEAGMNGPPIRSKLPQSREEPASSVKVAFLQAIKFYQTWLSPIGGPDRCGFRPSCSAYGAMAIKEQGPVIGLLMTADRLTRCHIWKKPGADYLLLPNGRLYDPPSKNLLCQP